MQQRKSAGSEFVEAGLITPQQLATAIDYQKSLGGTVGQIIIKLGYVQDTKLTNFLGKKYNIPIVDLKSLVLPVDLAKRIPWELIQKHQVVPIHTEGRTITIVTAEPLDYTSIDEIQYATSMQVEYNLAPRSHITGAIKEFAEMLGRHVPSQPMLPPVGKTGEKQKSATSSATMRAFQAEEPKTAALAPTVRALPSEADAMDVREATVSLLLKKGVITHAELYDAVLDVLMFKGVVTKQELRGGK